MFIHVSFLLLLLGNVPPAFAFDSNTISGLVSWIKADSELLNSGDAVSVIHDRSNTAHSYSGSGATYTTNYLNGKPAFTFNNIGGFLNSGFSVNGVDIFIVGDNLGSGGNSGIFSCQAVANSTNDYQRGGVLGWTTGSWGNNMIDVDYNGACNIDRDCALANIVHPVNVTGIMEYQVDSSNRYASISWNNVLVKDTTYVNPVPPLTFEQCVIGARLSPTLTHPFVGHILEVLVFDHRLSSTDRNAVFSYLQSKYNIGQTPTPIPTPPPTTKVVVVPGMGASWNTEAMLSCSLGGEYEPWELFPVLADAVYGPIQQQITQNNFEPRLFFYDWRREIPGNAQKLATFINNDIGKTADERVFLVGHSMGGLVGRSYLEQLGEANQMEKFMTVGSPHQGAVESYPAWEAGEVWNKNLLIRVAMTTLLKTCSALNKKTDREVVRNLIPSVQNLLPRFAYLTDQRTGQNIIPIPENQNNWPIAPLTNPIYGTTLSTLSGTGFDTLNALTVKDQNKHDAKLDNWIDGNPTRREFDTNGDGTVLARSSRIDELGDANLSINKDHSGLISSPEGILEILNFLGITTGPASATQPSVGPTSALLVIGYPADVWVTDPQGKTIKDTQGLVAIANPKPGAYKLKLTPKAPGQTRIIVAQFLKDGRTLWKEYPYRSILPRLGTINFDPANPQEDALR